MRTLTAGLTLGVLLLAAPASAQRHVSGFVIGVPRPGLAGYQPDLRWEGFDFGVSSTVELSSRVAFGAEGRYVTKSSGKLDFAYFESPVFARFTLHNSERAASPFVRLGFAPAFELKCKIGAPRSLTLNSPDTRILNGIIGRNPLVTQTIRNLAKRTACNNMRQHKLDYGFVTGIGALFKTGWRHQLAVELRSTNGARNLVGLGTESIKHRNVELLLSTGVRWF
jgi:hypothetical protein